MIKKTKDGDSAIIEGEKEYQNYYVIVYKETWTEPFKPRKKTVKIFNEHDHDADDIKEFTEGLGQAVADNAPNYNNEILWEGWIDKVVV